MDEFGEALGVRFDIARPLTAVSGCVPPGGEGGNGCFLI